mgnify:CR=1 FL=1
MEPLDKLNRLTESHGALRTGTGMISGVIALTLAILCLLGILAFHFPEYLTTPQLRKSYNVDALRLLMFWSMVLAGAIALFNIIRGRARWLAFAAFVLIGLTLALGGHKVPVGDFADGTPYIGLDWFILDLLGSTLIFVFIEKLFALRKDQPIFRHEWQTGFHLGFSKEVIDAYIVIVGFQAVFSHANVSVRLGPLRHVIVTPNFHHWHRSADAEAIDRNYAARFAFLDHLFGTAAKADRAWPERYGVVGDYVPNGYLRQLAFPFLWKP